MELSTRVAAVAVMLTAQFAAMNGAGWTGGDASWSARLPDGRVAWLFGDSFIGGVDARGRRQPGSRMVRNSIVVQDRDGSMRTLAAAAVESSSNDDWYWPGPPVVGRRTLQVPMAHIVRTGSGAWDFKATGTSIAEFALPSLRLRRLTQVATPPDVNMASAAVSDGPYTYIYGTRGSAVKHAFVARVPRQDLRGPWEYWDGTGWNTDPGRAAPVVAGVSDQFSVLRTRHGWLLVTQVPMSNTIVGFRSASPRGPWRSVGTLAEIPPIPHAMTYNATVHPEFSRGHRLVVGYNVNGVDMDAVFADASLYRPRFLTISVCR